MPQDLVTYHFNPIKTGQIFKQLRMDKGMSISSAAKRCGLTYDTVDNIERGRVQDIKLEAFLKLCCVYEQPMIMIVLLMLKGDDIDFIDKVLLYDNKTGGTLSASIFDSVPSIVPDTAVVAAEAVAATDTHPIPVRTAAENPDNVAQLHKHIAKLMELLELSLTQKG